MPMALPGFGPRLTNEEWAARDEAARNSPANKGFQKLTTEALSPEDRAKVVDSLNRFAAYDPPKQEVSELSFGRRFDYDGTAVNADKGLGNLRQKYLGGMRVEGGILVAVDPEGPFRQVFLVQDSGDVTGCDVLMNGALKADSACHFNSKTGRSSELVEAYPAPDDFTKPVAALVNAYKAAVSKI